MKHLKSLLFSTICIPGLLFGAAGTASAQSEITLLAPRPMQRTMDKVIENFQTKTGDKVKITYQSGQITRQTVAKGQPLDVSLIVAPYPGAIASGTLVVSSGTPIATFLTALYVQKGAPKPNISTPAALKKVLLAAKSIGYEDPDFAAAGEGAFEALTKLGIADQVAAKDLLMLGPGAPGASPSATTGTISTEKRLESGDIDIGLMLVSDMLPNKDKIDMVGVLPRKVCTPIAIVGFVSTRASDPAKAKALLQYLASPDAQALLKDGGYGSPRS